VSAPLVPRPGPFEHFAEWFAAARAADPQPEAVTFATVGVGGTPSARLVLVRHWDARGFEVYTNLRSRKAREALEQPRAALTWHWKSLGRQVRVEGIVEQVRAADADAYWATRPRGARLSALASDQSEAILDRQALLEQRDAAEARYAGVDDVPRPEHWGGVRVVPLVVEFWHHEDDRYHQRLEYRRSAPGAPWAARFLQP
jgi:pyridoxamine 5'-phosphate oxidase